MHTIILQHLPLITSRIEFSLSPQPELPVITLRKCFLEYDMQRDNGNDMGSHVGDNANNVGNDVDNGADHAEVNGQASGSDISSEAGGDDGFGPGRILIPKPSGEPGRPQSGGFNLERALNWPKATFEKIQVGRLARPDHICNTLAHLT